VAVGGGALLATSNHLARAQAYALEVSIIVALSVGVGLYWLARRPSSRVGFTLLMYAAAVGGLSLQGASNPLLHSIGVLFDAPVFLLGYYLIFSFPQGRLVGALEKLLVLAVAWALLASFVPWFFFSPVVSGGAPLAGCNANCPTNALMIANRPSIASGFGRFEEYLAVGIATAIVAALCYRVASASRPRRRALLPVYVPALLLTVPFVIFHTSLAELITLSPGTANTVGWFLTTGRTVLMLGFLVAIVQTMVFAGVALKTIIGRIDDDVSGGQLRALVSEALDDPKLDLAFRVDGGGAFFVDSRGDPIDPINTARGLSATALRRRDETLAFIVHDAALDTDPELVQAVGQAILLALRSGRLESELRAKAEELRKSRERLVAAGEAERRKLERDLHDGAQQRLMAIQVKLALAQERSANADLADELEQISADAAAAVEELRTLSHGIYPTVLHERGLADAIRSVAIGAPIAVNVSDGGIGRFTPVVETAIYFCSLEAIQNAIKHAGPRARVTVSLDRRADEIGFAIHDDGPGIDDGNGDGMGLVSMRDRIGAVGGTLIITSSSAGTQIRGTIPNAGSA
jgi:signal transduction histidine kinase